MLRIAAIAMLLLTQSFSTLPTGRAVLQAGVQACTAASDSSVPKSLKYCALIEDSRRYAGKLVRVSASWKFSFETSVIFDRKCPEQPGAWLEFGDDKDSCPETKKNRDALGQYDREADVNVTGRLFGPGNYGHLGAFQYKFVVTCLESIKITASDLK